MRFEISNIDEKLAKKIKIFCVKNTLTYGQWAEKAHKALINKQ